jgi:membrane-associated protein
LFQQALDIFFHLDQHLNAWAGAMGGWLYALLFAIIFGETGLVVTPFLPGDSLLFAVGAIAAATGSPVHIALVIPLLAFAAISGDAVNYAIGSKLGPKVFHKEDSRWLNRKYLLRAHAFYEKYGGKTIVLARFIPIVRTFAPFVAGIGKMGYRRFAVFNVAGGIAWVSAFALGGYWFGNLAAVKRNFHFVILAIIVISVMPGLIEYWRSRSRSRAARAAAAAAPEAAE